jgi:glutamate transport system substrate-binding protein
VCSVTGSTSIDNIKAQAPNADISNPFDTYSKCAEELKNDRVDAVTTDDSILYGLVSQNKGQLKVVGPSFTVEPYGIGLKKGDTAFRAFLNDRLAAIEKSGEWKKAYDDTVGKVRDTAATPPPINRY